MLLLVSKGLKDDPTYMKCNDPVPPSTHMHTQRHFITTTTKHITISQTGMQQWSPTDLTDFTAWLL